jgi:hypothetical protein
MTLNRSQRRGRASDTPYFGRLSPERQDAVRRELQRPLDVPDDELSADAQAALRAVLD